MGLTWRKIAFKCTLAMDKARIQERLAPSQLAVGIACGAEIMVHAARHWIHAHQADANYVLLQKDIRNAFNEVLPYEFLKDAQEYAPSSARFATFCYGTPSHLIYNGDVTMCYRGQQGCPIMGPLFCLTRQRMIEEARHNSPRGTPDFEPAFADDAFSGGEVGDVWASFQQELHLAEKYGLHMDPSKCTLYLLAGDQFRGDVSRFQALGVKIVSTTDVMMLKVPISQGTTILQSFYKHKIGDFQGLCKLLLQLPHAHTALYLLRQGGTYNKIQYWCRTMPRRVLAPLLQDIHDCQKHFLEQLVGKPLTPLQWTQAKLPTKAGGLGLLSPRLELGLDIVHLADLSYLASLRKCRFGIQALLPTFPCPQLQHLETTAIQHLTTNFPQLATVLQNPQEELDHTKALQHIHAKTKTKLLEQSDQHNKVRLTAYSATGADAWLKAIPSLNQDTLMSNVAFRTTLSMRLGIAIFETGLACSFCQQNLDPQGHHIMNCMGHGHKQLMHTSFRNVVYRLAQRARTQPKLEPTGLLPNNPQQRPADILINGLPDIHISSWRRFPRLALDCAITSPFQHHTQQVAGSSPLVSGTRYADLKRKHLDTKQQCEHQQIGFEPLIMESSGGMIGETANLLSSLCGIIDRHEGLSLGCTWQECQIRLAIDLHRGLHGACSKQLTKEPDDGALQRASAAFRTTCI